MQTSKRRSINYDHCQVTTAHSQWPSIKYDLVIDFDDKIPQRGLIVILLIFSR